jgi:hypothetical protein
MMKVWILFDRCDDVISVHRTYEGAKYNHDNHPDVGKIERIYRYEVRK